MGFYMFPVLSRDLDAAGRCEFGRCLIYSDFRTILQSKWLAVSSGQRMLDRNAPAIGKPIRIRFRSEKQKELYFLRLS